MVSIQGYRIILVNYSILIQCLAYLEGSGRLKHFIISMFLFKNILTSWQQNFSQKNSNTMKDDNRFKIEDRQTDKTEGQTDRQRETLRQTQNRTNIEKNKQITAEIIM